MEQWLAFCCSLNTHFICTSLKFEESMQFQAAHMLHVIRWLWHDKHYATSSFLSRLCLGCRAYWTLKTADQWLSLRLDFIGSMLILLTAILAIAERNHISPAIAALSLSQVYTLACFWTTDLSQPLTLVHAIHCLCVKDRGCGVTNC